MRYLLCLLVVMLAACNGNSTGNNEATANKACSGPNAAAIDIARADAEQRLHNLANHARVSFARTGTAPSKLTGSEDLGGSRVEAGELKFEHYAARDILHSRGDMGQGLDAAIVIEPVEEKYGFGAIYFDWPSGEREFKWYATKKELDDAIAAFLKK